MDQFRFNLQVRQVMRAIKASKLEMPRGAGYIERKDNRHDEPRTRPPRWVGKSK